MNFGGSVFDDLVRSDEGETPAPAIRPKSPPKTSEEWLDRQGLAQWPSAIPDDSRPMDEASPAAGQPRGAGRGCESVLGSLDDIKADLMSHSRKNLEHESHGFCCFQLFPIQCSVYRVKAPIPPIHAAWDLVFLSAVFYSVYRVKAPIPPIHQPGIRCPFQLFPIVCIGLKLQFPQSTSLGFGVPGECGPQATAAGEDSVPIRRQVHLRPQLHCPGERCRGLG